MHYIVLSMKTKCQGIKKTCTVFRINMVLKIKYDVKK